MNAPFRRMDDPRPRYAGVWVGKMGGTVRLVAGGLTFCFRGRETRRATQELRRGAVSEAAFVALMRGVAQDVRWQNTSGLTTTTTDEEAAPHD